jgi:hypothetical protein
MKAVATEALEVRFGASLLALCAPLSNMYLTEGHSLPLVGYSTIASEIMSGEGSMRRRYIV